MNKLSQLKHWPLMLVVAIFWPIWVLLGAKLIDNDEEDCDFC